MNKSAFLVLAIAVLGAVIAATGTIASRRETTRDTAAPASAPKPTPSTAPLALDRAEPSPEAERASSPVAPDTSAGQGASAAPASEFAALLSMPESTKAEKRAKQVAIVTTLHERTMPIFKKRFEAGLADYLYPEQKYSGLPEDEGVIYGVEMVPDKGTYRTVLPRNEYPALYELHDVADRLNKEAWALTLQESRPAILRGLDPSPR